MRRVTLKIAEALKEIGYPQPQTDVWGYVNRPNNCYFTGKHSYWDENRERRIEWNETNEFHKTDDWADEIEPRFYGYAIAAPTYFEIWLWLWREKGYRIREEITKITIYDNSEVGYTRQLDNLTNDPEEAIAKAIEYLIENDLIK